MTSTERTVRPAQLTQWQRLLQAEKSTTTALANAGPRYGVSKVWCQSEPYKMNDGV